MADNYGKRWASASASAQPPYRQHSIPSTTTAIDPLAAPMTPPTTAPAACKNTDLCWRAFTSITPAKLPQTTHVTMAKSAMPSSGGSSRPVASTSSAPPTSALSMAATIGNAMSARSPLQKTAPASTIMGTNTIARRSTSCRSAAVSPGPQPPYVVRSAADAEARRVHPHVTFPAVRKLHSTALRPGTESEPASKMNR